MTASRCLLAFAALATLTNLVGEAQAQSRRVQYACDQICITRPNAQCYRACFERDGNRAEAFVVPPRRVQPVSVPSKAVPSKDWRSELFAANANNGRGGNGNNAGGGNNSGGGAGRSAN